MRVWLGPSTLGDGERLAIRALGVLVAAALVSNRTEVDGIVGDERMLGAVHAPRHLEDGAPHLLGAIEAPGIEVGVDQLAQGGGMLRRVAVGGARRRHVLEHREGGRVIPLLHQDFAQRRRGIGQAWSIGRLTAANGERLAHQPLGVVEPRLRDAEPRQRHQAHGHVAARRPGQ